MKAVPNRLLACLLAIFFVTGGGAALAYWSSSASGATSAQVLTFQTVAVVAPGPGDAPGSTLIPGGSAGVILRVDNPNDFHAFAHSVVLAGAITADAGHPGCTVTGVTFIAPPAPMIPAIDLPPGQTLVHLPGAAAMDATSQSACQGATFFIPVTLTALR